VAGSHTQRHIAQAIVLKMRALILGVQSAFHKQKTFYGAETLSTLLAKKPVIL
jgi:hypothetical protein